MCLRLDDVVKYETPIPYNHPKGCVNWVRLDQTKALDTKDSTGVPDDIVEFDDDSTTGVSDDIQRAL